VKDNDDLIEIEFDSIVKETDAATLIDFGDKKIWLPKSQIDLRSWSKIVGIPQWLVEVKGLDKP
jgi:hypothetical protein